MAATVTWSENVMLVPQHHTSRSIERWDGQDAYGRCKQQRHGWRCVDDWSVMWGHSAGARHFSVGAGRRWPLSRAQSPDEKPSILQPDIEAAGLPLPRRWPQEA